MLMTERILISLALIVALVVAYRWFQTAHLARIAARAPRRGNDGASSQPALVYFWSNHCAPCVTQAQFLQQLPQSTMRHIQIQKIDAEVEQEMAASYGVFTLPTILLVDRHGNVKHVNYGLTDASKLANQLESVI